MDSSVLAQFDPNRASNPNNNIFGLPFTQEQARLVILPVPWEVTVSYSAGTARAPEHIFRASMQVDLFDADFNNRWREGFYMLPPDKKILLKSDFLRKEAELYIDYISKGDLVEDNQFMTKSLKDINEGGEFVTDWVYKRTSELLASGKLVALLGGDHSTPLGFYKAIAEKFGEFGLLQIDAHCDLRQGYENFNYSHASIMYNALTQVPSITKLVQVGIRDFSQEEWEYLQDNDRITTFFDWNMKEKIYEGGNWKQICDDVISYLPQNVFLTFDIDGLDPKNCPNTGTPVQGGLEVEQVFYLLKRMIKSGRRLLGFDLSEVGIGEANTDANVGARVLFRLCNLLIASNESTPDE